MSEETLDLVVLVADADAEWTVRTLLDKRRASLQIKRLKHKVIRYPGRDHGVFRDSPQFLKRYLPQARFAMVLFDRHGCGKEDWSREELESDLRSRLSASGWGENCEVIVLDPELEIWVWSTSPEVPKILGVQNREQLKQITNLDQCKPDDPKEAMRKVLKHTKIPHSPRIFQELARKVSLNRCSDPSFTKFKETLNNWFPREGES